MVTGGTTLLGKYAEDTLMVMTCAKCGSDRIVPNAKLFDRELSDGTIKAAFEKNPQAWLFKGTVLGKVRAVICGDCGFTELYTENSQEIYEAHQPPREYDSSCLQCGAEMIEPATACAACGWTYQNQELD